MFLINGSQICNTSRARGARLRLLRGMLIVEPGTEMEEGDVTLPNIQTSTSQHTVHCHGRLLNKKFENVLNL